MEIIIKILEGLKAWVESPLPEQTLTVLFKMLMFCTEESQKLVELYIQFFGG